MEGQLAPVRAQREPGSNLLAGAIVLAAGTALCRDAAGALVLPAWMALAAQAPLPLLWAWIRVVKGGKHALPDRFLSMGVIASAAVVGVVRADAGAFLLTTTCAFGGLLLVERLFAFFRAVDAAIDQPMPVVRLLAPCWIGLVVLSTLLLSIPLATESSVPDYRHNFMQHVLNSAHAAVSSATLFGLTIYDPLVDYTRFGLGVLFLTTQLAGVGFAAVGLSIIRPFLANRIRLSTVLTLAFILQAVAIAATYRVWAPTDAPDLPSRLGWSCLHVGSAAWDSGLVLRPNGLADYLDRPTVFVCLTLLMISGTLGLPIILDLLFGEAPPAGGKTGRMKPAGVRRIPHQEAALAFMLWVIPTLLVWLLETPGMLPTTWRPTRPVDLGGGRVALCDYMPGGSRWSLASWTCAGLRGAGMQSVPLSQGTISWPTFGIVLGCMVVGGSAAGLSGGFRTTAIMLWRAGRKQPDAAIRGPTSSLHSHGRRCAKFMLAWLGLNVLSICVLAATTEGDWYELTFEGIAAMNGVGLTTGLALHLPWLGRLVMIAILLTGRWLPIWFWIRLSAEWRRDQTIISKQAAFET